MNISWEWLTKLVDLSNIKPENLAEKLTLAGFEVENISYNDCKDIILEISTTANRVDTLSMIGMAREIAAVLERPLIFSTIKLPLRIRHHNIVSKDSKHTYSLRGIITNITVSHTPEWLKNRLRVNNIEPTNILEDIQNFIYIKWAQHIDFFDLDSLGLDSNDTLYNSLNISSGIGQRPFLTEENQLIENSSSEIITITNNKKLIALAGITTGAEYRPNHNTKNLLLQISKFDSKTINQASKILNLYTNNAHSHKKDLETIDLIDIYRECIFLITTLCLGSTKEITYIHRNKYIYPYIKLPTQEIVSTLGSEFIKMGSNSTSIQNLAQNIFKKLRFITWTHNQYLNIETPRDRINDISRGIDLIEELSRIYGFNKFTGIIPYYREYGIKRKQHHRITHIRSILRTAGLSEVMHSSLVENKYIEPIVCNPVVKEYNSIRSSLLGSILSTHEYNLQQGNSSIEIFEIGRVFRDNSSQYRESTHVAGIIGKGNNIRSEWQDNLRELTWFEAKGIMEEIFERIGAQVLWKPLDLSMDLYKELKAYFSINGTSALYCQDTMIGLFGTIKSPEFKISTSDKRIYGFEILANEIDYKLANTNYFKSYTRYPAITRDITMAIPSNISFQSIVDEVNRIKSPLIESVDLLNLYTDTTQNGNSRRLGFRITYRSSSGTLTNEMIENLESLLKSTIRRKFTN